jgi:FkbM family methyltransferase
MATAPLSDAERAELASALQYALHPAYSNGTELAVPSRLLPRSPRVRCALASARSQWAEDLLLLATLLRAAPGGHGRFVELGAFDGQTFSNTWLLERCFGWRGVLIEANPQSFARLRRARGGNPAVRVVHSAVCRRDATVAVSTNPVPMSGQPALMSERFLRRWAWRVRPRNLTRVPCRPLKAILADGGGSVAATFLSLDVEGAEEAVLETIHPAAFRLILVECDGSSEGKDRRVHRRMLAAGMREARALRVPASRIYLHPNATDAELALADVPSMNASGTWGTTGTGAAFRRRALAISRARAPRPRGHADAGPGPRASRPPGVA